MLRPFHVECLAWDPNNASDATTGDIILGSSSGGILLACRLETHGVVAARKLFQFPQPYSSHPIDGVAYVAASQSPDHPSRHVVLIAQGTRMFVFSSLWGNGGTLEAAFDASLVDCKGVVPHPTAASSYAVASPLCGGAGSSGGGGGLMNYIGLSSEAAASTTASSTPFVASASVECRHRALSSTVAPAETTVAHTAPDVAMPRLLSQVVIVDPRELIPTPPSALPASPAGGRGGASRGGEAGPNSLPRVAANELPPVFFWQCGDTLTQGVILLTDLAGTAGAEASRTTTHAPPSLRKHELCCPPTMRSTGLTPPSNTRVPLNVWRQSLLPIGILSVVSLARLLQNFSLLLRPQQGGTQRPPMFLCLPAGTDKNAAAAGSPPRPLGLRDVERLLLLRHGGQHGGGGRFTLPSLAAPPRTTGPGLTAKGEGPRPRESELQAAEKLVSVAVGYGHIVITTTRAVHVFCHLAALPLPQEAFRWKNALVFTRELVAPALEDTTAGTRGDDAVTVFCSHDVGRSQVFHLFAASYILDLRLRRRRRRSQYVAQLVDAAHPVGAGTFQRGTAEQDAPVTPQGRPSRTTGMAHQQTPPPPPPPTSWRGRFSSQPGTTSTTAPGVSSLSTPVLDLPSGGSCGLVSPLLSTTFNLPSGYSNDELCFEEWLRTQSDRAVNIPHIGALGGRLSVGFCTMEHYDVDSLYGMALRLAASASSEEERRELLPRLRHAYAARLFRQGRFLEAAAQHGLTMQGPPYLNTLLLEFSRVAANDMEPLILLVLLRLRGYARRRSGLADCSVELSCLTTWLVSLLLERCNQIGKERHGCRRDVAASSLVAAAAMTEANAAAVGAAEAVGVHRRSLEMAAYLRRKYNLVNPRQLLEDAFTRYGAFVEWQAISPAVFGMASGELTNAICNRLGHHGEVLSRLFLQQEQPLEGLLHLERYGLGGHASVTVAAAAATTTTKTATAMPPTEDVCNQPRESLKTFWLQYASLLMRWCPCRFVRRGLIPFGSELGLTPMELIPALLLYDPRRNETVFEAEGTVDAVLQRHAIEDSLLAEERARANCHAAQLYLEHVIYTEGYTDECFLNLLLYFTARDGDDAALTRFFTELRANAMAHRLEVSYAYRVCWQFRRQLGCAWTCFITGGYAEAVRLAMKLRTEELAIHFIRSISGEGEKELRHTLWKRLATAAARSRSGGSVRALQLVAESEGDLDVSDVLPHLSGDVMMQEFREELLTSVSMFSNTLRDIKQTIEVSLKDVAALKRETEWVGRRPLILPSSQRCAGCGKTALTRPFVAFKGCRHVYHKTCFDAARTNIEEQLRSARESSTPPPPPPLPWPAGEEVRRSSLAEAELECVLCSPRYLRLLLTLPLSYINNNAPGGSLRLP
ncbi:vacuolar protein sorting protein 18 [Trypanosoma conorhini]|uniref:Vacuolar protein sorting protein 18 n=1 Tax=Trypanosoma conorhini TaxID=83891 RepID=A0A3R7RWK5_9TRYP|nr:vacuolar protein sorting protein 18 [Trypanosoma conorhini]RNF14516.1 vacuolar protein sorting protein 18 [Trypanosoma conorhini]